MVHFYNEIGENWFDYQRLYTEMVNKNNDGAHLLRSVLGKAEAVFIWRLK